MLAVVYLVVREIMLLVNSFSANSANARVPVLGRRIAVAFMVMQRPGAQRQGNRTVAKITQPRNALWISDNSINIFIDRTNRTAHAVKLQTAVLRHGYVNCRPRSAKQLDSRMIIGYYCIGALDGNIERYAVAGVDGAAAWS